jgi:peroxiredoxin family protein
MGASGSVASTTSVSPGRSSAIRRFAIVSGRGQASPRASTVVTIRSVTAPRWTLAAILATRELERLYSGLSALVSTAAGGAPCGALATFRSLELMLADDLERRAKDLPLPETFARSLGELRDTALEIDRLELFACAASVETMGVSPERLDGVISMPRFLERAEGARLVFV